MQSCIYVLDYTLPFEVNPYNLERSSLIPAACTFNDDLCHKLAMTKQSLVFSRIDPTLKISCQAQTRFAVARFDFSNLASMLVLVKTADGKDYIYPCRPRHQVVIFCDQPYTVMVKATNKCAEFAVGLSLILHWNTMTYWSNSRIKEETTWFTYRESQRLFSVVNFAAGLRIHVQPSRYAILALEDEDFNRTRRRVELFFKGHQPPPDPPQEPVKFFQVKPNVTLFRFRPLHELTDRNLCENHFFCRLEIHKKFIFKGLPVWTPSLPSLHFAVIHGEFLGRPVRLRVQRHPMFVVTPFERGYYDPRSTGIFIRYITDTPLLTTVSFANQEDESILQIVGDEENILKILFFIITLFEGLEEKFIDFHFLGPCGENCSCLNATCAARSSSAPESLQMACVRKLRKEAVTGRLTREKVKYFLNSIGLDTAINVPYLHFLCKAMSWNEIA